MSFCKHWLKITHTDEENVHFICKWCGEVTHFPRVGIRLQLTRTDLRWCYEFNAIRLITRRVLDPYDS